jgi:uncharacterized protein with PQ loop repeat
MLATLLVVVGFIAIVCSLPQLFQLLEQKQSDEFNLFSWFTWIIYQLIALLYSLSIEAYPYVVINSLWTTFYIIMVFLIIKYRLKPKSRNTKKKLNRRK